MSATLNADDFRLYFNDAPIISTERYVNLNGISSWNNKSTPKATYILTTELGEADSKILLHIGNAGAFKLSKNPEFTAEQNTFTSNTTLSEKSGL